MGAAAVAMIACGTLLVGFACPWTRGAQGCFDDRNYPQLRDLVKMPRRRGDWEAFAWYGGWTLLFAGSAIQFALAIRM